MDQRRVVRVSKLLSKHLRHRPERIGLTLEPGGWVRVDELLARLAEHGFPLTRAELERVVEQSDKRRFAFDPSGTRIRASQGHSVAVDLQLRPAAPPEVLFHGTSTRAAAAIRREGLRPMRRQHVHLSPDPVTAERVGARHGEPVVLEVAAGDLARAGHEFLLSDNGVWLTTAVPPGSIRLVGG